MRYDTADLRRHGIGVIVACFSSLFVVYTASTQVDRIVPPDPAGRPLEVTVPWTMESLWGVLFRLSLVDQIAIGFEEAPDDRIPTAAGRVDPLDAFDALIRSDTRFAWQQVDRTFVIRPMDDWRRVDHFLNRNVQITTRNSSLGSVLTMLQSALFPGFRRPPTASNSSDQSIVLSGHTVLDVLNSIVQSNRGFWAVHYRNRHCQPSPCLEIIDGAGGNVATLWVGHVDTQPK